MLPFPSLVPYLPFPRAILMASNAKEIDESYASQISDLAKEFPLCCAAAALFYWNTDHPYATGEDLKHGLRVEATAIMREFVDKVEFGRGNIDSHKSPRVLMLTYARS